LIVNLVFPEGPDEINDNKSDERSLSTHIKPYTTQKFRQEKRREREEKSKEMLISR
jgi:hypothetical protein